MTNKDSSWQIIRGICIIAVVLIHCQTHTAIDGTPDSIFYLVYRNIINFPVAIFFFISGYFVSLPKLWGGIWKWYKSRFCRIGIPYLFWSAVWIVFRSIINHEAPNPIESINTLAIGTASHPYYYIIVLLYLTILTPLLAKLLNSRRGSVLLLLAGVLLLIDCYILQYLGIDVFTTTAKYLPIWVIPYYLGMLTRNRNWKMIRVGWSAPCVCLLLEVLETILLSQFDNFRSVAFSQLRITGLVYSGVLLYWLKSIIGDESNGFIADRAFTMIGDNSFGIFFIHCFFINFVDKVVLRYHWPLCIIICLECFVAVVGSLAVIITGKKMCGNSKLQVIFG